MAESISAKTAWALAKAIKGGSKKKLPNSGSATIVRVDQDGTHWVRISGSDVETPINGSITADARPGDVVQYHLEDTRISITGNATSPSVGKEYVDERVEPLEAKVDVVARANALLNTATERARSVADAASAVANAVNQHFFSDTSGIHVTEATQADWNTNHSGANVLINSIGQLFRDGLNNLLTLTTENGARALTVWDGLGNTADHIRAIIGEIIQLGSVASGNYVKLDDTGLEIFNENKTDGYSAKIGADFANFLGGMLGFAAAFVGEGSNKIWSSEMTHQPPNLYGTGGLLRFTTTNTGKSTEKTYLEIMADELIADGALNVAGTLTGNVKSAFVVSTVQLLEGEVSIAAGGSTNTLTASESRSGWYPLGIVGWASSYADVVLARCRLAGATDGLTSVEYVAKNTGTVARKPNINVRVLWVKC